jgi:amino acid adenylation domain-containing protein
MDGTRSEKWESLPLSVSTPIAESSICERIGAHARVFPDQLAVADPSATITFAQLEHLSNQLAAYLRGLGAGPDHCVALFMERSIDFVISALAVLKTGAAYLPLDSSIPADRAGFILADSASSILLAHRGKSTGVNAGSCRIFELDGNDAAGIASMSTQSLKIESTSQSLAYVIYTSGSTGQPNGVEITHANLLNLIHWHQSAFGITARDRASQVAGLGFDAAAWEIWPHLTAGASLHIADDITRRSPRALCAWLVSEKITVGFVPTVLAEQMLQMNWPADTALRFLLTGADTLQRRPATGLPFTLVNNYGPTECTVVATSGKITPEANAALRPTVGRPTIGTPIANATVFILDEALRPVATGDAGELCVAGALVGRGYRNRPELTASRFVTYTPPSGSPIRIYRTGDRARILENGEIAFLGRLDDQVKIRGYRIELGEIITCLDRYPGVQSSAVIVRDAAGGNGDAGIGAGPELIAYIIPADGAKLVASDLREFLAARLPDYMVPAHYVALSAFPLTANGKLDKSAFPRPSAENLLPIRAADSAAPGTNTAALNNPAGEMERRLSEMVASLVGRPSVLRDDNFFMVGGHSMLGVQLVARIRDTFGVKLTLRQLFGAPTVASLSNEVSRLVEVAQKEKH